MGKKKKVDSEFNPDKKYYVVLKFVFDGKFMPKVIEKLSKREPIKLTNLAYFWVEEKVSNSIDPLPDELLEGVDDDTTT